MQIYPSFSSKNAVGLNVSAYYAPRDPEDIIYDNAAYTSSNLASGLHVFHIAGLDPDVASTFQVDVVFNY